MLPRRVATQETNTYCARGQNIRILTPKIAFIIFNIIESQKLQIFSLKCPGAMKLALVFNVAHNIRYF